MNFFGAFFRDRDFCEKTQTDCLDSLVFGWCAQNANVARVRTKNAPEKFSSHGFYGLYIMGIIIRSVAKFSAYVHQYQYILYSNEK